MVMTTCAIIMLFGFAVLAIDVGVIALAKTQLQGAADAGALAAVQSYAQSGGDSTLATSRAIQFAGLNRALISAGPGNGNVKGNVVITAADVTFPHNNEVRVTTHRKVSTGDPIRTYFLPVVNSTHRLTEMTAKAASRLELVCGTDCLRPWSPPDKWFDANHDSLYNPNPVTNPTEYYDPITTGYTDADLGHPVTLYMGKNDKKDFRQSWYYPVDFPPINQCGSSGGCPETGGDPYREWIAGCRDNSFTVGPGDSLMIEPGAKVGPTSQGLADLIALDLGAYWNSTTGEVNGSAYAVSPRIIKAALFDPRLGVQTDNTGRPYLTIVKIMVLFIEGSGNGGTVTGRFMRLNSPDGTDCADQSHPTFLYRTALVE
jgi:Flp pilus assembly protein TadG